MINKDFNVGHSILKALVYFEGDYKKFISKSAAIINTTSTNNIKSTADIVAKMLDTDGISDEEIDSHWDEVVEVKNTLDVLKNENNPKYSRSDFFQSVFGVMEDLNAPVGANISYVIFAVVEYLKYKDKSTNYDNDYIADCENKFLDVPTGKKVSLKATLLVERPITRKTDGLTNYLYKFIDKDSRCPIVWFSKANMRLALNHTYNITGTVSDKKEYLGRRETYLKKVTKVEGTIAHRKIG